MAHHRNAPSHPLSHVFAWVTGGLSLLNLIRDLTPIELFGRVSDWVDAYSLLIRKIRFYLFAWLDWRWFNISETEGHVLVLTILFVLAWIRASDVHNRERLGDAHKPRDKAFAYLVFAPFMFLPSLIVALALPDYWGTAVTAIWLSAMAKSFAGPSQEPPREQVTPAQYVRREMLGVIMIAIAVVLVNYLFFRP